jgi:hypothetical protein
LFVWVESFGKLEKNSSIEKFRILLIHGQFEIHLRNGEVDLTNWQNSQMTK